MGCKGTFYHDTITRMVASQGQKGTFSLRGKTAPTEHQPSILMSQQRLNTSCLSNEIKDKCIAIIQKVIEWFWQVLARVRLADLLGISKPVH